VSIIFSYLPVTIGSSVVQIRNAIYFPRTDLSRYVVLLLLEARRKFTHRGNETGQEQFYLLTRSKPN